MRRLLPIFMLLIVLLQSGIGFGDVKSVEIEPENPVKGDVITIIILANPGEELDVEISFSKTLAVSDGRYELRLGGVGVPSTPNSFRVEARGVENLHVSVKFFGLWITKSAGAEGGVAAVSQGNVPKGTYDVIIRGEAEEGVSEVELRVKASTTITTDSEGLYEFRYDTSCIPAGDFKVRIDGYEKTLTLREERAIAPPPITPPTPQLVTPAMIESSSLEEALKLLENMEAGEIAEILAAISSRRAGEILSALGFDRAMDIFTLMPLNSSIDAILEADDERAVRLLEAAPLERGAEVLGGIISLGRVGEAVELLYSMEVDRSSQMLFEIDQALACRALEALTRLNVTYTSSVIEVGMDRSPKGVVEVLEGLDVEVLAEILIEMAGG